MGGGGNKQTTTTVEETTAEDNTGMVDAEWWPEGCLAGRVMLWLQVNKFLRDLCISGLILGVLTILSFVNFLTLCCCRCNWFQKVHELFLYRSIPEYRRE